MLLFTDMMISLCRLIYPDFEISQFFVHLILRIIKNQPTRAFADGCQLHQLRRPGDVVWDTVRDVDDDVKNAMRCMLVRLKEPWRQGLVNIGDLARRSQRFPNTSTLITPNIPCSWRTLRYWQQSPDGLREEWKRPYTSEPSTQASTEMEEGIIYHQYGTTSSRRKWRQTGRGGGGALSSPSRTASQTTPPGRLNWWSWQPSAKALVGWFFIILSIKCTTNCETWWWWCLVIG